MTKADKARNDYEEAFWSDNGLLVIREEPHEKHPYDLEERTARFGEAIIDFAKTIPKSAVTNRIISQSKKEFLKSIGICKKEAREVKHFLRMAVRTSPELKSQARELWMEAKELHLIFSRIWRSGKNG
jgi:hypothetical protein